MNNHDPMKITIISGFVLSLIISALVYFISLNQTQETLAINNDDILSNENKRSDEKESSLFSVTTSTDIEQVSSINTFFEVDSIGTYRISAVENEFHDLTVVNYKDENGLTKSAIIYLPKTTDETNVTAGDKPSQFRHEKWLATSAAIKKYTEEQSLFVSYWDNAQRIHLFTGRETWINSPDKNAYSSKEQQMLWGSVAGGFKCDGKLSKYSQYLLQNIETAIPALQKELPHGRDTYLLVTNDDLARIQEIAQLTGQGLPLETKLFPAVADLHNSISKVKEWAREDNGTGSYLIQPISEKFNRVWRITNKTFEDTLLVRLLPFTSSLDKSYDKTKLVYQSDWSAYLSIYRLIN